MALAVLAPLLGRGYTLAYDMAFAPRHDLLPDTLGLGTALPRAVPADAVVALLTHVVPGDLVQQLVLAAALFAGPLGAARYLREQPRGVQVVAAATSPSGCSSGTGPTSSRTRACRGSRAPPAR
jgi:hypothetical protein